MAAVMTDADFIAAMQGGPLTHLSLQHCPRGTVPAAPTNEDRRRALRDVQPIELHNAVQWPHLAAKEEACPQSSS